MNEDVPLPSSIEEIAALVLSFYEPASPSVVSSTQAALQRLQKSPQGWEIARLLLSRQDPKIKFFGALTIIVKLNTESLTLSGDDALQLLSALIKWLLESLEDGSGALVVRKLTSALATFFLHFHRLWTPCVRHLVFCLAAHRPCALEDTTRASGLAEEAQDHIRALSQTKMQAAIWFLETVADDATRVDMNSPMHAGIYQSIMANMSDISAVLSRALMASPTPDDHVGWLAIRNAAIKCFQSWTLSVQRISARDERSLVELRSLVQPVIESMTMDDELYEAAIEAVTDILSNYSGFLTQEHYALLHILLGSDWAEERYHRLVAEGDFDFDSVQFGHLLLSFGDARVQALMQDSDGRSNAILSKICGLLSAPGPPVAENKIFVPAIEFWSNFIEVMTDAVYSESTALQDWARASMEQVQRAISLSWQKIVFPPSDVYTSWDSADKAGFIDARKDVADLLQSSFTLMGPRLVSMFSEAVLKSLAEASWVQLEGVAFCLGALADCLNGDAASDAMLEPVFSPTLFLALLPSQQNMLPRTRQTCASLIEKYADYFERHPDVLPHALNLLFDILGDPGMALAASRSIYSLCWSCRAHLGTEVHAFIHRYGSLTNNQILDCLASERIMGAIAAVLQSLDREEDRASGLRQLLGFVHDDIQRSCEMAANAGTSQSALSCNKGDRCTLGGLGTDMALHIALRGLRCLVSIGKGLQVPVDGPVDLDAEDRFAPSPQRGSAMWQLQDSVMSIVIQVRTTFPASGEVVEAICNMLRTGFSETESGLFVLEPEQVCSYLTSHGPTAPRIGVVVSTACSFICSPSTESSTRSFDSIRARMLSWVISILQHLPEHNSDTEVSQNGIEFVNRLICKHPDVLLTLTPADRVEFFFLFSLRVLEGNEPLPKAAAADFWVTFITLRSDKPGVQESLTRMMTALGPLLVHSIMRNVGGKAARSELDKLSEPLKRLAANYVGSRAWIEAALADPSFPGTHVSDQDKSMFVKRVLSLRGGRATNQVVRDFWLASRGSSFAYTS